ncbi:MAG: small, acid-soluble spore protein, alpha/beta type [Syntrophomonadaceae bacterium]|jgi:small acid-soluble spore protein D (minor alpha/beta-type SASP)|nr:alpha/beta-type small acid-soluble spore protein [Bacillota bacterium]NLM88433.1 alpha/beta-type small acid-soluble spore protein [Syntrophomonadaceae bacterium]HAA08745.1 small, acid-soluble spore protein, alpha/beta type [Syntrophomonas sp.]HOB12203.1 alpha/beta-type small acid-soluble spore protein [Syntrophomonadaceae bacterium]HQA07552.1 alpha/beta-type small acid-soluble spore protein [Syntrophomonadaceae bacterium]
MASKGGSNQNRILVPQARAAMDQFKMEAAREVGVNLKQGYNGDLTTRQAGSIGGQMVKKMIYAYEQQLSGGSAPGFNELQSLQSIQQQNQ